MLRIRRILNQPSEVPLKPVYGLLKSVKRIEVNLKHLSSGSEVGR